MKVGSWTEKKRESWSSTCTYVFDYVSAIVRLEGIPPNWACSEYGPPSYHYALSYPNTLFKTSFVFSSLLYNIFASKCKQYSFNNGVDIAEQVQEINLSCNNNVFN